LGPVAFLGRLDFVQLRYVTSALAVNYIRLSFVWG